MVDIQSNADFADAAEFVGSLLSDYIVQIKDTLVHEGKRAKEETRLQYDEHFVLALHRAREIVQAFAGGKSLDPMRDAIANVVGDVENDPDLCMFWEDVAGFLKKMLHDPGFAVTDAADAEAHGLFDRSKYLLETKTDAYSRNVEKLFGEASAYITAIQTDKANRRLVEASKKVWNDVVVLRHGAYRPRARVVRDMFDVLLPKLVAEIKYIPLPRVEYQDKDYDLVLENVVLESGILPPPLSFHYIHL